MQDAAVFLQGERDDLLGAIAACRSRLHALPPALDAMAANYPGRGLNSEALTSIKALACRGTCFETFHGEEGRVADTRTSRAELPPAGPSGKKTPPRRPPTGGGGRPPNAATLHMSLQQLEDQVGGRIH